MKRLVPAIAICLLALVCASFFALRAPVGSMQNETASVATVMRVVDGDTITVSIDGASEEKVRLIGIDAPESVSPDASKNCEAGKVASAHLKAVLPAGSTVWLVRDVSDTDKYGRLLRYVWISDPTASEPDRGMLNAILVNDGYAQAKEYPPDIRYASMLEELGRDAVTSHRGVTYQWL